MELDPIVLLAYASVAINIITVIAAVVAYVIFKIRKQRRRKLLSDESSRHEQELAPVFLRPYQPPTLTSGPSATESAADGVAKDK